MEKTPEDYRFINKGKSYSKASDSQAIIISLGLYFLIFEISANDSAF